MRVGFLLTPVHSVLISDAHLSVSRAHSTHVFDLKHWRLDCLTERTCVEKWYEDWNTASGKVSNPPAQYCAAEGHICKFAAEIEVTLEKKGKWPSA